MANILLVGTATLDVIFQLERYPMEDDEIRARGLRVCRGGNAANTSVVLSQLGHRCSFVGVLAESPESAVITQDFASHAVDFNQCPRLSGRPPTSSIYLSGAGRTIVHYRDLQELTSEQFCKVDLSPYSWIHLECRNVPELQKMLHHIKQSRPDVTISMELEKPRDGMEKVLKYPDLLICSRGYARYCGHESAEDFLNWRQQDIPHSTIVVAWAESGAYGKKAGAQLCHAPAFPPVNGVVDTLGAGDTFNAGLIDALAKGKNLDQTLESANRLAGRKCGLEGFELGLSQ